MIKLTRGQKSVLITTSLPMAAVGVTAGYATYLNMTQVLGHIGYALSLVAAGEGAVFVAALISLSLTLLGQHTPRVVRSALWVLPAIGSTVGAVVAPTATEAVVLSVAPLGMTVAGEGIALVARRIVAFQTGVDLEQQRRAGALMWHANRAANGGWYGTRASRLAVWRLTRQFAETDAQMSVQLGEVQRYRIAEGADANLASALSGPTKPAGSPSKELTAPAVRQVPELPAHVSDAPAPLLNPEVLAADDGMDFIRGVLAEAEQNVAIDTTVTLMTAAEVAAMKGVSAGTVRSWVARGKLTVADRDENGRNLFSALAVSRLD
jgi:hypothetical protein